MITGEELAAYVAGEADPALVARVESAVSQDADLAARLDDLRRLDDLLAQADPVTMTTAEQDRLLAAVDRDLDELRESAGDATASDSAAADRGDGRDGAEVVDLGSRRRVARTREPRSRGWFDPMRLAGVAAALVVVVGIGAVVASGGIMGGADDSGGESADMAAAPAEDDSAPSEARSEAMMDVPAATEESAGTETSAATEAAGGDAAAEMSAADLPVVDDGRVVQEPGDLDPAALRRLLRPSAQDETTQDFSTGWTEDATRSPEPLAGSPDGPMSDGRVTQADRDTVRACLPAPAGSVLVAEVVILAPDRPAILYVLEDRVVVVDADTCAEVADLTG